MPQLLRLVGPSAVLLLAACAPHATGRAVPDGRSPAPVAASTAMQPVAGVDPALDRRIAAWVTAERFTGVVLVARHTQVVALHVAGLADAEAGVRTTPATRYELGSITKWVASLAVLALVDQGRLALDAPITTYLPEYRGDTGARVTLHHLLTHTSGIPNAVIPALRADSTLLTATPTSAESVRRWASGDLAFAPGSRFDYAHVNWLLVRAIVERVTGQPYAEAVQALVWAPLALRASGTFAGDFTALPDAARGYATLDPVPRRRQVPMPTFLAAAGGAGASAPDLLRLLEGVYDGPLLRPATRATLSRVAVPEEGYAYGSRVRTRTLGGRPRTVAWHTGTSGAYRTLAARVLDDGWTVLVLGNASPALAPMGALADSLLVTVHP